ncbi:MAG: hypothetical protein WEB52_05940 [Dehalococcoidia bacterium]
MVRTYLLASLAAVSILLAACGGGDGTPDATPTPERPGPEQILGEWVAANRNINFIPNCNEAKDGIDVGKLCATLIGERGTRRAFALGPTFSEPTALAILEEKPDGWEILSVQNRDPSQGEIPGIPWPLQGGDRVIVIGLGEGDCLSIRQDPSQTGERTNCMPDGTRAIVQEGPEEAETFTWWRIAGDGFSGWAAENWLRLEDAIAAALQPQATPTASE